MSEYLIPAHLQEWKISISSHPALVSLNVLGCCNRVIEIKLRNHPECYGHPRQVKADNEKHCLS